MNNRLIKTGLLLLAITLFNTVGAEPANNAAIKTALQQVLPGFNVDDIRPSPVSGVSEVLLGPRLFYVTNDGRFLIQGSMIDLKTREDISESRRKVIRLDAVNKLGENKMVIFPAKQEKHAVTVFTDVDCTYCRKLHREIKQYNDLGITVRYLLYPRSGVNTPSYHKAVSIWCEKDRQGALTRAKAGEQLKQAECDNPVQEHMHLGELIGLRGTPAIVLSDGELVPGYVPADKLAKSLDDGS